MDPSESHSFDTQSLAVNAKAGDPDSFNELYRRLVPALHSWASLRLHKRIRSRIEAEDIVQETFVRAYRLFPEFDAENKPFRRWMFSIAKFVLLEQIKKVKALHVSISARSDATRADWINECPDNITTFTRQIARDEIVSTFLESVNALSEDDQKIVLYCGLEGLTAAEAGKKMELSAEATAKRWQRVRHRLRELGLAREWMA